MSAHQICVVLVLVAIVGALYWLAKECQRLDKEIDYSDSLNNSRYTRVLASLEAAGKWQQKLEREQQRIWLYIGETRTTMRDILAATERNNMTSQQVRQDIDETLQSIDGFLGRKPHSGPRKEVEERLARVEKEIGDARAARIDSRIELDDFNKQFYILTSERDTLQWVLKEL